MLNGTTLKFNTENEDHRPYLCHLCNSKFVSNDDLQKHIKRVHGEKPFQCSTCDLKVATKYQLNSHVSAVHEGKKPFKCSKCTTSFAYKNSLKNHFKVVHEEPLICDLKFAITSTVEKLAESVHERKKTVSIIGIENEN